MKSVIGISLAFTILALLAQTGLAEVQPDMQDVNARLAEMASEELGSDEQVLLLDAIIAEVLASGNDEAHTRYLAEIIARANLYLGERAPLVIGGLSKSISDDLLGALTASAVLSSGTDSPVVLEAIVAHQDENEARTEQVLNAARRPLSILDVDTAEQVQSPQVASSSAGLLGEPVLGWDDRMNYSERQLTRLSISEHQQVLSGTEASGTGGSGVPPRPPSIPPRPPAIPYRGQ